MYFLVSFFKGIVSLRTFCQFCSFQIFFFHFLDFLKNFFIPVGSVVAIFCGAQQRNRREEAGRALFVFS